MSFFYNLNKRLADLAKKTEQQQIAESKKVETVAKSPLTQALNESKKPDANKNGIPDYAEDGIGKMEEAGYSAKKAAAGKDIGKPGKNFAKIAKSAGKEYGSKEAGERVAGAVLNKLRHPKESAEKDGDVMDWLNDQLKDYEAQQQTKEGNAFTGALKSTPKGGKFKVGGKEFTDTSSLEEEEEMDEGYAEMDAWLKSREKEKGTGRFDKKKISTGTVYTRKPETFDDPETDPEATGGAPKRKGRPAGTKRAIGAKHSGRSKLASKDAIAEEDHEVCSECGQSIVYEKAPPGAKAERMVKHIKKSLSKDGKLSDKDKAIAYATTWKAHNAGKVEEESTDKEDTKAEKAGRKVAKDIEHDEGHKGKDDNRAEKAGKKVTKDIEYDDKKDKEEKVDETTTSGSVATASPAPKSSKGMQFGKGVYESLDSKLENMIAEGMNVSVNVNTDAEGEAQKSITVTATGEDADKLAELLKMAGLQQTKKVCPGCGSTDCGCDAEMVDENSPDWPTNTETKATDPELRTYSGGLNGPKSTGQSTTPVLASQLRRQTSMEEGVKLERTLSTLYKNYKAK